jgi:hypothetical protein
MLLTIEKALPDGRLSRREWLRIGGVFGLGPLLSFAASQRNAPARGAEARSIPGFGRAKAAILVFASGGQSQIDTWDPKPEAPADIRGDFKAISTSVTGVQVCEHLPKLAHLANKYTIIRSVTHDDLDHGSAVYLALTGHFHPRKSSNPPPRPTDEPTLGAVLKRVRPSRRFPYTALQVNGPALVPEEVAPGQFAGFLGPEYEPLVVSDPTQSQQALEVLAPRSELPPVRMSQRRRLLDQLDEYGAALQGHSAHAAAQVLYDQAFQVLGSDKCRRAFDLDAEPSALRDRYGRYPSGQACLLARRLVEAGVPLVTVILNRSNRGQDKYPGQTDAYGWDTHNDIFEALRDHLLPRFDQTFSALLEDLDARGLLDETLVLCFGEFGRAPRVALEPRFAGSSPGRKHWANAYSIVAAGAGVRRGAVYGASDRIGGSVADRPVTPGDIAATIFSALGIDPAGHYRDSLGRPLAIATGQPITGLY